MAFTLPPLPYAENALEPVISAETISYHYGKHHQTYVTNLNNLIKDTELEGKSLEDIICSSQGGLFNNAAQVFNHTFYWNSLTPDKNTQPSDALVAAINKSFGSFEDFKKQFSDKATTNFASGWTWLVKNPSGDLSIINTDDADTVITDKEVTPLLVIDVWEHAYYIDYRNARPKYIESFWDIVNWNFVSENFAS